MVSVAGCEARPVLGSGSGRPPRRGGGPGGGLAAKPTPPGRAAQAGPHQGLRSISSSAAARPRDGGERPRGGRARPLVFLQELLGQALDRKPFPEAKITRLSE